MFEPSAFGMVVPDPQAFPERLPFWCLPLLSEQSRQACKKSSPILKACPDVHMSLKLVVIACRIQWRPSSGRPPCFQHACRHCHLGLPRGNARCLSTAWMSDRPCWPSSGEALSVGPAMQRSPNMVFIAGVCHRGSGLVSLDPSAAALAVMLVSWCSCSNHLLEHQWCGTCPLMAQHPQMRCRCQKRCSPQPVEGAQRAQSAGVRKTGSGQTCSCSAALGGGAEVPSASPTVLASRKATSMSLQHTHCCPLHVSCRTDALHASHSWSLCSSAHSRMNALHAVGILSSLQGVPGSGFISCSPARLRNAQRIQLHTIAKRRQWFAQHTLCREELTPTGESCCREGSSQHCLRRLLQELRSAA